MARSSSSVENRIIDALIKSVAERGWLRTTLVDIAADTNLSLAQIHQRFPSKTAILLAFLDRLDDAVVAGFEKSAASEPARDRLFDVVMRRFDAVRPYKEAVRRLGRELPFDPPAFVAVGCHAQGTLNWMLETAHLGEGGLYKCLKGKGLALIWGSTTRAWLNDDSEDMGPTMAHLDTQLRRADRIMACLPRCRPRRPTEPEVVAGA